MVNAIDLQDTLHALVADVEANGNWTTDEKAFLVAYHASLNAGATTKADDMYFFCYLMKRFISENVNYGAAG